MKGRRFCFVLAFLLPAMIAAIPWPGTATAHQVSSISPPPTHGLRPHVLLVPTSTDASRTLTPVPPPASLPTATAISAPTGTATAGATATPPPSPTTATLTPVATVTPTATPTPPATATLTPSPTSSPTAAAHRRESTVSHRQRPPLQALSLWTPRTVRANGTVTVIARVNTPGATVGLAVDYGLGREEERQAIASANGLAVTRLHVVVPARCTGHVAARVYVTATAGERAMTRATTFMVQCPRAHAWRLSPDQ